MYRAANVFRQLVGGRIDVHVERRPNRKTTNVSATFVPLILPTVQAELGGNPSSDLPAATPITVWLRKPPRRDLMAERVHELIDNEKMSFRDAATFLQNEGFTGNSGVVWQIYHRYYEMIGQPLPDIEYNNGHPRKRREQPVAN